MCWLTQAHTKLFNTAFKNITAIKSWPDSQTDQQNYSRKWSAKLKEGISGQLFWCDAGGIHSWTRSLQQHAAGQEMSSAKTSSMGELNKQEAPYLKCPQSQSIRHWDLPHQRTYLSRWHGLQYNTDKLNSQHYSQHYLKHYPASCCSLFAAQCLLFSGSSLYCFRLRASSAMYLRQHVRHFWQDNVS